MGPGHNATNRQGGNVKRLEGEIALITGGANGIGRATAARLAQEGATVCIVDREADALGKAEAELAALGGRVLAISADCLEASAVEAATAAAIAELGRIDILVNNLGQSARERATLFLESSEEVWRFVFEINLFTTMRFTRLLAPAMCERRHGRIINLTSDAALIAPRKSADYAAAKAAVIGLTRATAREFGPYRVTVNAVGPGPTRTRALERANQEAVQAMIQNLAVDFIGDPEDIAATIAHLASKDGRYVTGQTLLVNGGGWWT